MRAFSDVSSARPSRRAPALVAALIGVGLLAACQPSAPVGAPSPSGSAPPGTASAPGPSPSRAGSPTGPRSPSAGPSVTPSATPTTGPTTTTPSPSSPGSCARGLDEQERIGQLIMVGVASTGLTDGQARVLQRTRAGSVIMMGNSSAGVAGTKRITDDIRARAHRVDGVDLLVATDHEGGAVQRLKGTGFDTIPSAARQAQLSDAELRASWKRWAGQLEAAGVDSPLAPVADVVPASLGERNQPVGRYGRGYGADVDVVEQKVTAVVSGMHEAGAASAIKHFPGLGRVVGNTDFASEVTDTVTTRDDPLLGGFDAAVADRTDMIMVSTAVYTRIDPDHPAAFSATVIDGMLRQDRGFTGVVISDDLGVAKQVASISPGQRAVRFLRAGGDLIIDVDPASAEQMTDAIAAEAADDPQFAAALAQKVDRVLAMKTARGLTDCSTG